MKVNHASRSIATPQPSRPEAQVSTPPSPKPQPMPASTGDRFEGSARPTSDRALREARSVWVSEKGEDKGFRRIHQDPYDVNGTQASAAKANKLLAANAPEEKAALAALDDTRRQQYDRLKSLTAQDPQGRLALQALLVDGKLTSSRKNHAGDDLLGALDRLAQQPLASGLKRTELISDLVQELAIPSAINQKNKNTCAPATMQILWATKEPAELVRVVSGLASPEGRVRLAGGTEIGRVPGTERPDGSSRSASSRLWQAALIELGNGPNATYDNAKDQNSRGFDGLDPIQIGEVLNALTGRKVEKLTIYTHKLDDIISRIDAQTKAGSPVPIGLKWGERDADGEIHGGHMVLATGIQGGRLYFNNPWGIEESLPLSEIKARLTNAHPYEPLPAKR
ncbi:hypothetical protein J7643_01550 [bacterium]|nr:hypothetical protein [bacterium]